MWGSDTPRHPRQIVDVTENGVLGADDTSADVDTSVMSDYMMENQPPAGEENIAAENNDDEADAITEEPVKSEPVKTEPVKPVVEERKTVTAKATPKTETKPKPAAPATPPATKTSQPISQPSNVSSQHGGKHLVIAGNFLQQVNANQRMQELKKAGFNNVEVVNFDLSEYHTVCAGRFDDVNEARKLVKKLKDYHQIDAYVRIGS